MQNGTAVTQSGFGIASFILAILSFLVACLALAGRIALGLRTRLLPGRGIEAALGVIFLCMVIPSLVGIILGIIGLVQQNRRRGFATAGLILNLVVLVGIILITVLVRVR